MCLVIMLLKVALLGWLPMAATFQVLLTHCPWAAPLIGPIALGCYLILHRDRGGFVFIEGIEMTWVVMADAAAFAVGAAGGVGWLAAQFGW